MPKRNRLKRKGSKVQKRLPPLGILGTIGKVLGADYWIKYHKNNIKRKINEIVLLKQEIKNIHKRYPKIWKEVARDIIKDIAYYEDYLNYYKIELKKWKAHRRAERKR